MGMLEEEKESNVIYLWIAAGKLWQKVDESTPWAVRRDYELSDWTKWFKFEKRFNSITGYITGITFNDWKFGKQLAIRLWDWANVVIINLSCESKYFGSFASKLPNIKAEVPVTISAYDFETDEGKRQTWLSIIQLEEKVLGYYYDAENKKTINGLPSVTKEESKWYQSDDWKIFFIQMKKFYIKALEETAHKYSDANIPAEVKASAKLDTPKAGYAQPKAKAEVEHEVEETTEKKFEATTEQKTKAKAKVDNEEISVEDLPF